MRTCIVDIIGSFCHVELERGFASGHGEAQQMFAQGTNDASHVVSLNLVLLRTAIARINFPDVAGLTSAVTEVRCIPEHLVRDGRQTKPPTDLVAQETADKTKVESEGHPRLLVSTQRRKTLSGTINFEQKRAILFWTAGGSGNV